MKHNIFGRLFCLEVYYPEEIYEEHQDYHVPFWTYLFNLNQPIVEGFSG